MPELGEEHRSVFRAEERATGAASERAKSIVRDGRILLGDTVSISPPASVPHPYALEAIDGQLSSLVGRTVIAANEIVSAWAMLYAAISGHSLPFVGSLFDKWARESLQRERIAKLAREFLQKLPRELEQIETLLATADDLARERDLLVNQPWSLGNLDEQMPHAWLSVPRNDLTVEREAQFEWLLTGLQGLHADILQVVEEVKQSRDIEKVRVLNRSAVLAAEFKFGKKAARPKVGPRHKDWVSALDA